MNQPVAPAGALSSMTPEDAIRWLAWQAQQCREHDEHEAFCLLLPALVRVLELAPMNGYEADVFRDRLKFTLEHDFRFDPQPSTVGCGGAT